MPTKTNKNSAAAAASRTPETESALKELFVDTQRYLLGREAPRFGFTQND
jgi:hypothetical protein